MYSNFEMQYGLDDEYDLGKDIELIHRRRKNNVCIIFSRYWFGI